MTTFLNSGSHSYDLSNNYDIKKSKDTIFNKFIYIYLYKLMFWPPFSWCDIKYYQ